MRKYSRPEVAGLITVLKASAQSRDLIKGRTVHEEVRKTGNFTTNTFLQNSLINMYSKCGCMHDARLVFDAMPRRTVVSWTSLILGYAQNGSEDTALDLFRRMSSEDGCRLDAPSFVAVLKACTNMAVKESPVHISGKLVKAVSYKVAREIHSQAANLGFVGHGYVCNTLLDLYAKCGRLDDAEHVFWGMPADARNAVSWTCLMLGYVNSGDFERGLYLFGAMQCEGFRPDGQAFVAACKACGGMGKTSEKKILRRGMAVCDQASRSGLMESDVYVASALVDMFAKLGCMVESRKVFEKVVRRDVVCWTALVLGYAQNGEEETALEMFFTMQRHGCLPDSRTYVAAILACICLAEKEVGLVKLRSLEKGMRVHSQAVTQGCDGDVKLASTLVDFYSKCGDMDDALRVFTSIPSPDVISWTALVLGLVHNGEHQAALTSFRGMFSEGCVPDSHAFAAALRACGALADVKSGRLFHALVHVSGLETDVMLVSSLVEMYCKCGRMNEAMEVFENAGERAKADVVIWASLMAGYCRQGDFSSVLRVFEAMQESGVLPDGIIFTHLLTACSHAGMVDKAREYMEMMRARYGLAAENEHYHNVVDLLGRINRIEEAFAVVKGMPCGGSLVAWMTLLAACEKWGNSEVGKLAFEKVMALDDKMCAAYVLMSNACTQQLEEDVR